MSDAPSVWRASWPCNHTYIFFAVGCVLSYYYSKFRAALRNERKMSPWIKPSESNITPKLEKSWNLKAMLFIVKFLFSIRSLNKWNYYCNDLYFIMQYDILIYGHSISDILFKNCFVLDPTQQSYSHVHKLFENPSGFRKRCLDIIYYRPGT